MYLSCDWSQDFSILSNIRGAFTHDLRLISISLVNLGGVCSLLVQRPRTVHSISHRCALTEMTITFLFRLLLGLVFSLFWVERESVFAFLILFPKSLSNGIESDARDLLAFLIPSKEQISQNERMLFCIVDSQQMGVSWRVCTDHKVSATQ